jgi:hypothetical protein
MAKRGRKPTPDEEKERVIAHILAELSAGRPVSRTCREDEGMPEPSTFWRWHFADEELRTKVADARANGIEAKMDEAQAIAEMPMMGEIVVNKHINVGGVPVPVTEVRHEDMLGHRKLLVDTIHKQAQMLKPKTYGPKLDLTSGGEKLALSAELEAARKRLSE